MHPKIEIYVRPSADDTFLTIYVPESLRDGFIEGLKNGVYKCEKGMVNLELAVLPEWLTDTNQKEWLSNNDGSMHMRTGLTAINIYNGD